MPNSSSKNRNWFIIAGVFTLAVALYLNPSLLTATKSVTVKVLTSPYVFIRNAGVYFVSKAKLLQENKSYYKKIADLSLEIFRMKNVSEENDKLRALLKFKKNLPYRTVAAEVVAREPNGWIGSFIIDRGTSDGIGVHSAVCSSKGLLGKVVETGKDTSFVILLTHPDFKVGGVIAGDRINGVVVGAGSGMAKMLYIPMDTDVKPGSVVLTSEHSRIFPKGIAIGEVVSVQVGESGLYKCAIIKPYANLFNEEQVLCTI